MPESRKFIQAKPEPLKNSLNADFVNLLAKQLKKVDPNFDEENFKKKCIDKKWDEKELKQRIRHISKTIHEFLPYDYKKQIAIILNVAKAFRGLPALVFPDFVEVHGLSDVETSLEAMEILTQYSTAEFAIRPFIFSEQKKVLARAKKWAKHSSEHVRRLASEGIRPRLPWAMALPEFKKNPNQVLEILELLKNDPSEYVRRSVANNLNDITKDHPELVLKIAKRWIGKSEATDKLLKHACRTLLKKGNVEALNIFGFKKNKLASIGKFEIQNPKISIGESLLFSFELKNDSKKTAQLRIEYIVHFLKNNGTHSQKVFQLSSKYFAPGIFSFERKHRFKDFTTRKHYPGKHFIAIAINGVEKVRGSLELVNGH